METPTEDQVFRAIFDLRQIQTIYLEKLKTHPPTSYKDHLGDKLFADLADYSKKGLTPNPRLQIPPERLGKVSDEALNKIFALEHQNQIELEALFKSYLKDRFATIEEDAILKAYLFENLPRQILALYKSLFLSPERVLLDIGEDLRWRCLFAQWKSLEVIPLSKDEDYHPMNSEEKESKILSSPLSV